jgi:hypothetical protein
MQWGDVTGDGVGENFMSIASGSAQAATVCRQFLIPVFLPELNCEPVGAAGHFCQRSLVSPSFFIVRTICTTVNTPPMDGRMRQDTTGVLNRAILSGEYSVVDASTVSSARDTAVTFGIPGFARFARPEDFGNVCPTGTVQLSAAGFAALGSTRLCVETTTSPAIAQAGVTVNTLLSQIDASPSADTVDINLPRTRTTLEEVLGILLAVLSCRVDLDGITLECISNRGLVTVAGLIKGLCPTKPDENRFAQCQGRGEQSSAGCAAIACIEALDSLPFLECVAKTSEIVPSMNPITRVHAATIACALIRRRDHYYTVPRSSVPTAICTRGPGTQSCSLDFVLDVLLSDARNQAPGVLQGPPIAGIARPFLTQPLPIDTFNPNKLYYLGNVLDLNIIGLPSANTSNPVFIDVNGAGGSVQGRFGTQRCDLIVTNRTQDDHLLEGQISNCLFDDGSSVRSLVVGTGTNTRNALANEIFGVLLLGSVQDRLRDEVMRALAALQPPPCSGRNCPRVLPDF